MQIVEERVLVSPMETILTRDGLSGRLRKLADRLDRLRPLNHDPEAYFVERDDIRKALMREAGELDRPAAAPAERGRFEDGVKAVNGRLVRAERRGRFALRQERPCPNQTRSPGSAKPSSPTISATSPRE
jgi:hypothetical protein